MSGVDTLVKNKINSDVNNNLILNNTLQIKRTTEDTHTSAGILLKNKSSTGSSPSFAELHVADANSITSLYLNPTNSGNSGDNQIIISNTNIESELEEVYKDKSLNIKNLSVGKDNSTDNVYVNFLSNSDTNTEENGIGLKYEQSSGNIFYKNRGGSWVDITSSTGVSNLNGLTDVTLSSVADKQLLVYNNSTSKFENKSNITLPGTLDLGGNLTVGSNYLKFNNEHGLVDSVGNEIINLKGNTSDKGDVNYIQIENAAPGGEPKLKTYGSDSSIGLDIETKGEGDITLTSESGNVVVSGTNLDISGYTKNSIYSTSSNASYAPDENWNVPISSDSILFNFVQDNTAGTYLASITQGVHGQKLNVIFNNSGSKSINVLVDFDNDNLITGTGLSRKLNFVGTGQCASLVYLGNSINKWQILNTGAIVT
jgi:hypothetical protein